ncbi:hypothetical protein OIV83_003507 [Microbotryomycetes sp. JL201]|nr:hypothetical protein OIV83_003507 [Microbotryomycetes sp. JL201]
MGLFGRRSSSVSSASSVNSNPSETSSQTSVSLLSRGSSKSAKGAVKSPKDLPFNLNTTASPNSRLLSLPTSPVDGAVSPQGRTPLVRSRSANSATGSSLGGGSKSGSAKGSQKDDESESEEESSEAEDVSSEDEQEEQPARSKEGPTKAKAEDNSNGSAKSSTAAGAAAGGGLLAGILGSSTKRTESPPQEKGSSDHSSIEEEEDLSEEEESESEEDDEYAEHDHDRAALNDGVEKGKKRRTSRAAQIAIDKMNEDVNLRSKKGKPLANLTAADVALTDDDLAEDISVVWKAMHLFLSSRMIEAEDICLAACDHRLYYSVGYALIQSIKSLATFEPEDLEAAIQCCRDSILIANLLRKKDHGLLENVGRLAKGSTSVNSIRSMTRVQRHAELVFSECTLLKAVLGIIYSGDFVAFLKEAINMRNAYAIYRTLAAYVDVVDKEYGGEDPAIDNDFRSGVFLGNGMISLILSLLPSAVLKIMTVFGFTGDREYALQTLMRAGLWKPRNPDPGMDPEKEGIRRPICDMTLLMHHLVIANYLPVDGVDVPTAAHILKYHLDRYPNGIFFLYFAGRLHSTETQLEKATKSFHAAIAAQREYIQLGHICYWDLGLVSLAMGDYVKGFECFNVLDKESNWSKAIYAYAKATSIYEEGEDLREAARIMSGVPDLMQRIAGKSIPLEKFVARRARKFVAQNNRLTLPGIELAYVLNCLGLSPRFTLFDVHLDQVSTVLAELHAVKDPRSYGTGRGDEFWDDYCLAHLLRGIILHFMSHPQPHVVPRPAKCQIPVKEAEEQALISFNNVLKHGRDISHDHHLVWFCHYELGRLYASMKDYKKARYHFELVMSGKGMELSPKKTKGKVSLQVSSLATDIFTFSLAEKI